MEIAKGSIRQRGSGSFELRVYGGTDPNSGRRRWLTRTVRGDRSVALRELKALAAHANIAPAVGAHTTVAALLDQWFARGQSTWSPTTTRNLTSIVERHLKPGLGDILVGDLTTAIVDGFYEDLRSEGRIDGKPLAVGTVRRIHSALHAALGQAQRWSWVFENVADQATPPRDEPVEMRPPTPGQVAQLLEFASREPVFHLYLTLAATTGARRGQLLAMRWIDVDLVGTCSQERSRRHGDTPSSGFPKLPRPQSVLRSGRHSPTGRIHRCRSMSCLRLRAGYTRASALDSRSRTFGPIRTASGSRGPRLVSKTLPPGS